MTQTVSTSLAHPLGLDKLKYEVEKPFKIDPVKLLTFKAKTSHPRGFVRRILPFYLLFRTCHRPRTSSGARTPTTSSSSTSTSSSTPPPTDSTSSSSFRAARTISSSGSTHQPSSTRMGSMHLSKLREFAFPSRTSGPERPSSRSEGLSSARLDPGSR